MKRLMKVGNPRERIPGGLAASRRPADFDRGALARGTAVELEHTDDPRVAQEIAMDHLAEDEQYYEKLARMEARLEATRGNPPLHLAAGVVDVKATETIKTIKLRAKNRGDLSSAIISAAFHAKKHGRTMYVYAGSSYMVSVWRVAHDPTDYLCPITNIGARVASVTPDLTISWSRS